ncbi:MAG: DUF359 domain-containing protein [Candidatus Thermoplasmatota archaeon]
MLRGGTKLRKSLILPEEMREELRKPFGKLIRKEDIENFLKTKVLRNGKIVCVGDVTANTVLSSGLSPKIVIIDFKTKRKKGKRKLKFGKIDIKVYNPPGTITSMLMDAIKEAYKEKESVRIIVNGEEDLAVLPSIIYAPLGTFVLYGQPDVGIVSVRATKLKKKFVRRILGKFRKVGYGDRNIR